MLTWETVAAMFAVSIPLAAFIIGAVTFIQGRATDRQHDRTEDCERCFQERDTLRQENQQLQRQGIELMRLLFEQPHKIGGIE